MMRAATSKGACGTKQCNENEIKERKGDRQERMEIGGETTGSYSKDSQARTLVCECPRQASWQYGFRLRMRMRRASG